MDNLIVLGFFIYGNAIFIVMALPLYLALRKM